MTRAKRVAPLAGLDLPDLLESQPPAFVSTSTPLSHRKRVFLLENHPITRDGFTRLLDTQPDLQVCGHAGATAEALDIIATLKPDVVVADLSLSASSRLDLLKNLKARHPDLPVLILSAYDESLYAERAVRAGARGYVMKHASTAEVMNAVRRVLAGELYFSNQMQSRLVHKHVRGSHRHRRTEIETLTDRELEIFQLIGRGKTTRRIAGSLHLSVSTVETHRAHIKEKLHLKNAVELVRRAVEWTNAHLS